MERRSKLIGAAAGLVIIGAAGALLWGPEIIDDLKEDTCDEASTPAAPPAPVTEPGDAEDAPIPEVQAQASDAFADSVGFNTHLFYFDTPYGQFDELVRPALVDLGVRHIRDGGNVLGDNGYLDMLRSLHDENGIDTQLIFDPRAVNPDEAQGLAEYVGDALVAGEATNEYDATGPDWRPALVEYATDLDAALAGDPDTADVPLVGPSFISFDASAELASADPGVEGLFEFGNAHPYAYPFCPSSSLDRDLEQRALPTPGLPMVITEIGYHTATEDRGVTEEVQAKYYPRLFLEAFRRGVVRTYAYELVDEFPDDDPESRFGIIRPDGTRKPAFDSLQRLMDLTEDPGPDFEPGALGVRILAEDDTVSHLLLQRRDGTFVLVLWNEIDSTDADVSVPVTVQLAEGADVRVEQLDGSEPVQHDDVTELDLDVPDRAVVLSIG